MSDHDENSNPFSASRIRPGSMPFLFAAGQRADAIVERLRQNAWWGQIVGPHGTGKSSLLAAIIPVIQQAGQQATLIELHDGQRCLPGGLRTIGHLQPPAVLIVDGYEQLSRWSRYRLKRFCKRRALGLLVTCHETVGLPELFRPVIDQALAWQVVEQLQQGRRPSVTREDLAERLEIRGGDLREALFDMYDLYQRRNRQG